MSSQPVSFGRHLGSLAFAVTFAATGCALVFTVLLGLTTGGDIRAMAMGPMIWLMMLFSGLMPAGFFFTVAWLLLRKAKSRGQIIAVLWGVATYTVPNHALYAVSGKALGPGELSTTILMGAATGWAYWWWARPELRTLFRAKSRQDKRQLSLPI